MKHELVWELPSSDGWNRITCSFIGLRESSNIIAAVACHGQFWDRAKSSGEGHENSEIVNDFAVQLPQIIIPRAQLVRLRDEVASWLESPNVVQVDLGTEHQALRLCLNEQEEMISSMDRPVCELAYKASRLDMVCRFVTDHSCVNILFTQLSGWLSSTAEG